MLVNETYDGVFSLRISRQRSITDSPGGTTPNQFHKPANPPYHLQ